MEKITTARTDARGSKRKAAEDSDDEAPSAPPKAHDDKRPGNGRDRPDKRSKSSGTTDKPQRGSGDKSRGKEKSDRPARREGEKTARGRERTEKRDRERAAKASAGLQGDVAAPAEKRGIEKLGANLGSMIGRKRKMRKSGK